MRGGHFDRERPVVVAARAAIQKACADFFGHQALHLASLARGESHKLAKAAADDKDHVVTSAAGEADYSPLRSEIEPQIRTVAQDGARAALEQVGVSADELDAMLSQVNQRATDWAAEEAAELIKGVADTTKDRVRALVAEALAEGWSNDELADALGESDAFDDARAELIARTETARADVTGSVEGWRASGVVGARKWIVGDGCCDECQALVGEEVAIDEEFEDGDPPLHPNCRCDVSPVLADEGDDEE